MYPGLSLCPLLPAGPGAGTAPAPSHSAHSAAASPCAPAGPRPRPDCPEVPHAPGPGCPAAVAGLAVWLAGTEPEGAGRETMKTKGLGYSICDPRPALPFVLHLCRGQAVHTSKGQGAEGRWQQGDTAPIPVKSRPSPACRPCPLGKQLVDSIGLTLISLPREEF